MSQTAKLRRRSRIAKAALILGSVAGLTVSMTGSANAAIMNPLPWNASTFQNKYMPLFDYDDNGCLPATAVDASGRLNGGLQPTGSITGGCRTNHLAKANTYAQSKCQNGWCAYVYALYFEKDQAQNGVSWGSHRHDWECVVVFQKQGEERPRYLAASRHGGFSTHPINEVPMDGNHVKIVYHKDGSSTHAFRFAKWGEVPRVWGNGNWDTPTLVTMENMAKTPRDALWDTNNKKYDNHWGKANFPLTNNLIDNINKARPSAVPAFR
ncbi:NPP1 family protein [Streptomyces muensis]|uniref:NPP1 family protein n=1 Tax=Streptomyces muensis TaxID=1077944 RepID=A0A9X1TPF5_STRM4|nr:NPP1 family protein [Streptomyces muensis]MCF1598722.1 NPP1 family protein [Streptomyces muensis]